ncbi:hypothetical protein GJAV_G00272130 [Gymnothorax javanicus]|nr:hypothetical protein GJAV_G00272130 [Gymnothorax javanicus]
MGSCCSCPDKESIPDNHQSKFKVINVDDDGNELGSGVMELTEEELTLHTHKRHAVRWPYLCLRRYGYDSNLFSFESGRHCQTRQGIFAFKCARAEELFNMLQDIMHSNSISVVEEPVLEPPQGAPEGHILLTPRTPTSPGYATPSVPNGIPRYPSFGDAPSRPSSRHPSAGSARLPSVGEESTHPLLVADKQLHTYVNTTGMQDERRSLIGAPPPLSDTIEREPVEAEPEVLFDSEGVKFVLGPTPVQKQQMAKHQEAGSVEQGGVAEDPHPAVFLAAQRRTALLDYENLPALTPVWETRKSSAEEAEPRKLSLNGFNHPLPTLDPTHCYINTENVTTPLSAFRLEPATPTVFNFDFRRPSSDMPRQLNYIEVETEKDRASDCSNPHTPKTPGTPLPPTPTRRTELYAVIDIQRTAAMSSLQKALPRADGTTRKTRHNSTELPT